MFATFGCKVLKSGCFLHLRLIVRPRRTRPTTRFRTAVPAACDARSVRTVSVAGKSDEARRSNKIVLDYVHVPPKIDRVNEANLPPIIFLHGLLASWRTYRSVLQRPDLAPDRSIYALDLRNHGSSPHSEEMSYDSMIGDLLAFMTTQNISRACLMGHSMGGKLAMAAALAHPHVVSELIVMDAAPVVYKDHSWQMAEVSEDSPQAVVQAIAKLNPIPAHMRTRRDLEEALRNLGIRSHDVRQFALTNLVRRGNVDQEMAWRVNISAIARNMAEIMGLPKWMQEASRQPTDTAGHSFTQKDAETKHAVVYRGPTLFIRGSRSAYVQDAHWPVIRRLFPNASLVTIDGAGHWLQSEKPDEFTRIVNAFLNRSTTSVRASESPAHEPVY
jgi:esterase